MKGVPFEFEAKPWKYEGPGGWVFITFPPEISTEIRQDFKNEEEGWGRLPVTALIGSTEWKTAIWFDNKKNTYLLPLKAIVRKSENIGIEKLIKIRIWIRFRSN